MKIATANRVLKRAKIALFLGSFGAGPAFAADLPTTEKVVEVNVPAGETLTVSRLADYFADAVAPGSGHYFNKTGDGTLILAGDVQYLNMNISNGVVRLARTDGRECLRNVNVSAGAMLAFDQDAPIRDAGSLELEGKLDVNGHVDCFSALTLAPTACIVNSSSSSRGKISLTYAFYGADRFTKIKIRPTKAADGGSAVDLDELAPTYQGVPVIGWTPSDSGGIKVSSEGTVKNAFNLYDKHAGNAVNGWPIGDDVVYEFPVARRIDGYRMSARDVSGKMSVASPVSWEVYAYANDRWTLVDRRENVPVSESFAGRSLYPGRNFQFAFRQEIAETVDIDVNGEAIHAATAGAAILYADGADAETRLEVKSGRTSVVSSNDGVHEAKWVRITPTATGLSEAVDNIDNWGYMWAIASFRIIDADGKEINASSVNATYGMSSDTAFTAGTAETRTMIKSSSQNSKELPSVVLGYGGSAKRIKGYAWRPSKNSNDYSTDRLPRGFVFEVSTDDKAWNDGTKLWRQIDISSYPKPETETYARDSRYFPATSLARSARYFRFEVCQTLSANDSYVQLAELNLYRNGSRVAWPDGATVVSTSCSDKSNKLVNNIRAQADPESRDERILQNGLPYFIEVDAGEALEFDAFGYTSTGGGFFGRMPKTWMLLAKENADDGWQVVQRKDGDASEFTQNNYTDQGPWALDGGNVVHDGKSVMIQSGATLELNLPFEKFGALCGAGTLQLDGARAEISQAGGDFSGTVTGSGTLVVSAGQSFADAGLAGVSTLELAAGALTGTASFGGRPLVMAFTGGVLDATLSDIGNVTVTGGVKIAIPGEDAIKEKRYSKTLIENAILDDAAKAAFRSATFVRPDASHRVMITVDVTDTSVVVHACLRGFVLYLR